MELEYWAILAGIYLLISIVFKRCYSDRITYLFQVLCNTLIILLLGRTIVATKIHANSLLITSYKLEQQSVDPINIQVNDIPDSIPINNEVLKMNLRHKPNLVQLLKHILSNVAPPSNPSNNIMAPTLIANQNKENHFNSGLSVVESKDWLSNITKTKTSDSQMLNPNSISKEQNLTKDQISYSTSEVNNNKRKINIKTINNLDKDSEKVYDIKTNNTENLTKNNSENSENITNNRSNSTENLTTNEANNKDALFENKTNSLNFVVGLQTREDIGGILMKHYSNGFGIILGVGHGEYILNLLKIWSTSAGFYLCDPYIYQWRNYDTPDNLDDNQHQIVFETLRHKLVPFTGKYIFIRDFAHTFAKSFKNNPSGGAAFIYFDANPSEKSLYRDLAAWWEHTPKGAIIGGNNFTGKYSNGTKKALERFFLDFSISPKLIISEEPVASWFFVKN